MISDKEYSEYYEQVRDYINEFCLVRNTKMPGKIPGTTYTWCFYLRNGLFNPGFMTTIAQMFVYKIQKEIGHFNFQLAGLETASTPMLSGIPVTTRGLFKIEMNAFSIRKNQKEYALQNWIEGIPNHLPVMIIDDLCNSSMSMKKCYDVIKATRVNDKQLEILDHAFCIVNKVNKKVHDEVRSKSDMYLPSSIKMISLYDLDDFNLASPSH